MVMIPVWKWIKIAKYSFLEICLGRFKSINSKSLSFVLAIYQTFFWELIKSCYQIGPLSIHGPNTKKKLKLVKMFPISSSILVSFFHNIKIQAMDMKESSDFYKVSFADCWKIKLGFSRKAVTQVFSCLYLYNVHTTFLFTRFCLSTSGNVSVWTSVFVL